MSLPFFIALGLNGFSSYTRPFDMSKKSILFPLGNLYSLKRDAIIDYVSEYDQKYIHVLQYQFLNQLNSPPFVIALEKAKAFPQ